MVYHANYLEPDNLKTAKSLCCMCCNYHVFVVCLTFSIRTHDFAIELKHLIYLVDIAILIIYPRGIVSAIYRTLSVISELVYQMNKT